MEGFSLDGPLAAPRLTALYDRARELHLCGRLHVTDGDRFATVEFVGGDAGAVAGTEADPEKTTWHVGTARWRIEQAIPDLSGALTRAQAIAGDLGETITMRALLHHCDEHRLTTQLDVFGPRSTHAIARFAHGRLESLIVDGKSDLGALPRLERWRSGRWQLVLRPLFGADAPPPPPTVKPPKQLDGDGFDVTGKIELADAADLAGPAPEPPTATPRTPAPTPAPEPPPESTPSTSSTPPPEPPPRPPEPPTEPEVVEDAPPPRRSRQMLARLSIDDDLIEPDTATDAPPPRRTPPRPITPATPTAPTTTAPATASPALPTTVATPPSETTNPFPREPDAPVEAPASQTPQVMATAREPNAPHEIDVRHPEAAPSPPEPPPAPKETAAPTPASASDAASPIAWHDEAPSVADDASPRPSRAGRVVLVLGALALLGAGTAWVTSARLKTLRAAGELPAPVERAPAPSLTGDAVPTPALSGATAAPPTVTPLPAPPIAEPPHVRIDTPLDVLIAHARHLLLEGHTHTAKETLDGAADLDPSGSRRAEVDDLTRMALGRTGHGTLIVGGAGAVKIAGAEVKAPTKLRLPAGRWPVERAGGTSEVVVPKEGEAHVEAP